MSDTKVPHKKVTTGCVQCKQRRVKCDESRPSCISCKKRRTRCSLSVFAYSSKEPSFPMICAVSSTSQSFGSIPGAIDGTSLSLCDLELLHHWTLSTSQTIGSYGHLRRSMQEIVPRLALDQPFLMHALLALSALHLNFLDPSRSDRYLIPGMRHYTHALPAFRATLSSITEENCHALFAFGHLITKYAFANPAHKKTLLFSPKSGVLADFVYHLRGAFSVHDTAFEWLASGPLESCLEAPLDFDPPFDLNPDDSKLADLLPHLETGEIEDDSAVQEALIDLRRLFAINAMPKQTISTKTLVYCWLARLPSRYLVLMSERRPQALIVLAHYCIMLKMIDEYWFMRGWSRRLLQQCQANLSGVWLQLISWPLSLHPSDTGSAVVEST